MRGLRRLIEILGSVLLLCAPAAAQTRFEILHAFETAPAALQGYAPSAPPVLGLGGLYGTTISGGTFDQGTVYCLTSSGLTTIHHFSGTDGGHPAGALALGIDFSLYGTTYDGGAEGRGTIFRISVTGEFQTLHSFTSTEGRNPTAGLVRGTDGNFWGTTLLGGTVDAGTAFRISPAGGFTQVRSFGDTFFLANVLFPYAPLIQASDGNFYGTTFGSTRASGGSVYRMTPAGQMTALLTFSTLDPLGAAPRIMAGLTEGLDGWLYGGACCGSTSSLGGVTPALFRLTKSGNAYEDLRAAVTGGNILSSLTLGSDGGVYGATATTLFRIDGAGNFTEYKDLADLAGTHVSSGLRAIAPGWFIGSTYDGGPTQGGLIFLFRPY